MNPMVHISLQPSGKTIAVAAGTPLADVLFPHGVDFPCGGQSQCKGCRVRVLAGHLPVDTEQRTLLSAAELAEGWRLACRCRADGDLALEIGQWEQPILADASQFAFTPRDGLGVAIDLGTTTLVTQLLDLRTGEVLAVRSGLNPQAAHGSDIMSRIQFAAQGGQSRLEGLIRSEVGRMVGELIAESARPAETLHTMTVVGNTAMHHLLAGIDVSCLAGVPFETEHPGRRTFAAAELGWRSAPRAMVHVLPCLGSFVGSDILAGIVACGLDRAAAPAGLVDLGTNGEIVIGDGSRMLCASTAAGPAFEGARIDMGLRAAEGAIDKAWAHDGRIACHVIGGGAPRGICGSGLVDAVVAGAELALIEGSGRLSGGAKTMRLSGSVRLTQGDIRELQLAKAAIAAGIEILASRWGVELGGIQRLSLAGAFGNYINRDSARRIGLLPLDSERIVPAGNTALLGAKMALFAADDSALDFADLRARIEHVPLASDPEFMNSFVDHMRLAPAGEDSPS